MLLLQLLEVQLVESCWTTVQVVEMEATDVEPSVTTEVSADGLAPCENAKFCARVHRKR